MRHSCSVGESINDESSGRLMKNIILEVCVDTLDDAITSRDAGVGRIELCSSLEIGGLTPSHGLVKNAIFPDVPVFAMIRPRGGDFVYSEHEVTCMLTDIDCLQESGVSGFVFGALNSQGNLDGPVLERLICACKGLPTTLNRAFDLCVDPLYSLEVALQLGFDRILTSDAAPSVVTGLPLLKKLFAKAKDQITIMPGGGVTPETAENLLDELPIREIHASCKKRVMENRKTSANVNVGRTDMQQRYRTDAAALNDLLKIIATRSHQTRQKKAL